jgi:hypothetical protein
LLTVCTVACALIASAPAHARNECPPWNSGCYGEAGGPFVTKFACAVAGQYRTGEAGFGYMCIATPPSGDYYLWIWDPNA